MFLSEYLEQSGLDIDLDIGDGDVLSDIVCLARVVRFDEQWSALISGATEHTDEITQLGMAHLAIEYWREIRYED